ncbi:MAG TPA: hypothetical protein VK447_18815 [Myxococcaceae bacterium]|nr:hypothetical protein [Myxococcaceae bacterium]
MFVGATLLISAGDESGQFWDNPWARPWHLILSLQVVIWVASVAWLWRPLFRPDPARDNHVSLKMWPLGGALVVVLALVALSTAIPPDFARRAADATKLPHLDLKMRIFNFLGATVATLHVWGILSVHGQVSLDLRRLREGRNALEGEALSKAVVRYQKLREQLHGFVGAVGTIIGGAALSVGMLRNLGSSSRFPTEPVLVRSSWLSAEDVLALGLYLTILLAILFVPAHHAMSLMGNELAERLWPPLPRQDESWKKWQDEQTAVRGYLGLQRRPLEVLQASLSTLAPLVGSVSALALGVGNGP